MSNKVNQYPGYFSDKIRINYHDRSIYPNTRPKPREGIGAGGRAQLYINDKLMGNTEFPTTVPNTFGIEGLSCGYDFGEAISHEYESPFRFTGKLHEVTLDLSGELIKDDEADQRMLMAQQ